MTQSASELLKSITHPALISSSIRHISLGSVGNFVPSYCFLQYFLYLLSSLPHFWRAISVWHHLFFCGRAAMYFCCRFSTKYPIPFFLVPQNNTSVFFSTFSLSVLSLIEHSKISMIWICMVAGAFGKCLIRRGPNCFSIFCPPCPFLLLHFAKGHLRRKSFAQKLGKLWGHGGGGTVSGQTGMVF